MARKRITRRDPEEELSKFLRHEPGQGQETRKLSSQLTSLKKERRRGLLTRLGSIMAVCLLAIAFLTYYVSPTYQRSGCSELMTWMAKAWLK